MMRWPHSLLALGLTVTIVACASDATTAPSGLAGSYHLRSVNGVALPIADPACCDVTLDSGSIQVRERDTIQLRTITHNTPANGLPGVTAIAIGFYVLQRAGGGFALQPGAFTNVTPPPDTLYILSFPPRPLRQSF